MIVPKRTFSKGSGKKRKQISKKQGGEKRQYLFDRKRSKLLRFWPKKDSWKKENNEPGAGDTDGGKAN